MDFSSSSWMSSLIEGQTISRTVDGNIFTITSSGNIVYINGFPVTVDQWNQVLQGKEVKLSFQGKQAILSSVGSNVMFNGHSITMGSNISNQISFDSSSSINSGNIYTTENVDFSSSSWMSSLVEGQTITRTVDGNVFSITSSGNIAYINGFPVTIDEWNQALKGNTVTLTFHGRKASLTSRGSNVLFNGKSLTEGHNISTQVSFGTSSTSNTKWKGTGKFFS